MRWTKFSHIWIWIITLFAGVAIVYITFAAGIEDRYRRLAWVGGVAHSWGTFRTLNGNAGTLDFDVAPTLGGYTGAHIFSRFNSWAITNTLTGHFWMETVGWVGWEDASGVIMSPDPTWNPRGNWTLSGNLWSDSVGWIDMGEIVFVPDTSTFSGYAWNDGIGWINIFGATFAGTSTSIIWKVKVLWNAWGSRIFNTVYDISQKYSSVKTTQVTNAIQKNLTLLMRNAWTWQLNRVGDTNVNLFRESVIYQNTGITLGLVRYSDLTFRNVWYENMRSIIVIGANFYIDQSVLPPVGDTRPRAIIVLPNDRGIGWNIFISGDPTRIESSLIAWGSIFSASFPPANQTDYTFYNSSASSTIWLPDRQLYIYGTVVSNNTIGGSSPNDGASFVCPFMEVNCTRDVSIRYDWNYFRWYEWNPAKRWYNSALYDAWSVIIEYNQGVQRNPPPGLIE